MARKLEATICVPWRPSPSRIPLYERVREFWDRYFPAWPVIVADSDTDVFSLAQARNNAVRKARTEVVVIADADTVIDVANIEAAVADPERCVYWPFTHYRILSTDYLYAPFGQLHRVPYMTTSWDGDGVNGVGGCIVTTQTEFWRLGGQPPEFIGWGWEDTAFTAIVGTLSKVKRIEGNVYAFEHNSHAGEYHDALADSPGWDRDIERNRELMVPYHNANGRQWLMRHILELRQGERALIDYGFPVGR